MSEQSWILFALLMVGAIGGHQLITIASTILLLLTVFRIQPALELLEHHCLPVGICLMLIGVMLPLATGKVGLGGILGSLTNAGGLIALIVGAISAHLAARGVALWKVEPEVMIGLIVGSLLGVAFCQGIPNGPLMSAGIVAVILRLLR